MAYWHVEPFGSDIEDARLALLMHLIASALGAKDIAPDAFSVNRRVAGAAEPEEPDVDESGTVSKAAIAALAMMLGADLPPT